MLVMSQNKDKLGILYENELLEIVWVEVPSYHRWNECATRHSEEGKRPYHAFENICNSGEIKCWILKNYLFEAVAFLFSLGKSLKMSKVSPIQKTCLASWDGITSNEIMAMERAVGYLVVRFKPSHWLPRIIWESHFIQNSTLDKIQLYFSQIFAPTQSLHTFIS